MQWMLLIKTFQLPGMVGILNIYAVVWLVSPKSLMKTRQKHVNNSTLYMPTQFIVQSGENMQWVTVACMLWSMSP